MNKQTITKLFVTAALVYGGIYIYQRYKRRKSNETVVSYDEAIDILNKVE